MNSPGIRFAVPPLVFTLCFVTAGALQWFLFSDIKLLSFLPFMLHSAFGLVIGLAGFAFMMAAWFHFLLIGTTVTTSTPVNILVENGAFHYSRNPMYVGFVSLLVAGAVGFNSLPFLIAAAFMFVYLSQYIIPREERYMNAAFPESYPSYCRKVRRWL